MSLTSESTRLDVEAVEPPTTLEATIAEGPVGWVEACVLMAPVADAIADLHEDGELHLQLEPNAVTIVESGSVTLVTLVDPAPTRHSSLNYCAPEMFRDVVVGPEADVYSLGALLLALVSGTVPFTGRNNNGSVATMARINELPAPLYVLPDDLPPALVELIRITMAKRTASRAMTARHFASVLAALARGDEVRVERDEVGPNVRRADSATRVATSDSSLMVVIAAMTLFLVLIIGGAGLGVLANQPDGQIDVGVVASLPVATTSPPVAVAGAIAVAPVVEEPAPSAPTTVPEPAVEPVAEEPAPSTPTTVPEPAAEPVAPSEDAAPAIVVLTNAVPDQLSVAIGQAFVYDVVANDSLIGPASVELTGPGELPAGVELAANGVLAGVPERCGGFDGQYRVTSEAGSSGTATIRLTVTGCDDR